MHARKEKHNAILMRIERPMDVITKNELESFSIALAENHSFRFSSGFIVQRSDDCCVTAKVRKRNDEKYHFVSFIFGISTKHLMLVSDKKQTHTLASTRLLVMFRFYTETYWRFTSSFLSTLDEKQKNFVFFFCSVVSFIARSNVISSSRVCERDPTKENNKNIWKIKKKEKKIDMKMVETRLSKDERVYYLYYCILCTNFCAEPFHNSPVNVE